MTGCSACSWPDFDGDGGPQTIFRLHDRLSTFHKRLEATFRFAGLRATHLVDNLSISQENQRRPEFYGKGPSQALTFTIFDFNVAHLRILTEQRANCGANAWQYPHQDAQIPARLAQASGQLPPELTRHSLELSGRTCLIP